MNNFKKSERLCSQKLIEKIFQEGNGFLQYPFKVYYLNNLQDQTSLVQVAVSVPKRRFKRAVMRNLIRRRIKESYRKNKIKLLEFFKPKGNLSFLIVYIANESLPYSFIESKIKELIDRLILLNEETD